MTLTELLLKVFFSFYQIWSYFVRKNKIVSISHKNFLIGSYCCGKPYTVLLLVGHKNSTHIVKTFILTEIFMLVAKCVRSFVSFCPSSV